MLTAYLIASIASHAFAALLAIQSDAHKGDARERTFMGVILAYVAFGLLNLARLYPL